MHEISNNDFSLAVELLNEYISSHKDSHDLATFNKARRARLMLRKWSKNEAYDKRREK